MSEPDRLDPTLEETLADQVRQMSEPDLSEQQLSDFHDPQRMGGDAAYQAVAQATAIAVQDSANYLRSLSTIMTAVIGSAMSKLIETKDPTYANIIEVAQKSIDGAAQNFKNIGVSASAVARMYPHMDTVTILEEPIVDAATRERATRDELLQGDSVPDNMKSDSSGNTASRQKLDILKSAAWSKDKQTRGAPQICEQDLGEPLPSRGIGGASGR